MNERMFLRWVAQAALSKLVASLFHHFRRLVMNIRAQVIVLIEITMNGIDGGVGVDPY